MNSRSSTREFFLGSLLGTVAALLIAVQLFFILKDASWTLVSDDFDFLIHFASGIPFLPSENLFAGRFTPLAFLEYNLLIPFGDSPAAYYVWVCFKYIITLVFFFLIQREIFDLSGLNSLSKEFKLILLSICTIIFLLLPGLFVVFLDVVYYENTSIPISMVFIYTLISVFKRVSLVKMMFLLVLFNVMLYLKETYVVFFLPFVLMGMFLKLGKDHPIVRKLILAAFISFVFYSISYFFFVYLKTDVFYHEERNAGFFTGTLWLIFLNPTLVTTLIFLSTMVVFSKNNFVITPFISISAISVCVFFLITGMYAMSYQLSIVYPFVFFTAQLEITTLVRQKHSVSKFVLPLLIVLTLCSGVVSLGTSRRHLIGRGNHFSMLQLINQFRLNSNSLTYIYKGGNWQFSKLRLGVALDFITNGGASLQSPESIGEIDNLSEVVGSRNAILFFPDDERQSFSVFESHKIDTVIEIDGFDYNAIVLKKN